LSCDGAHIKIDTFNSYSFSFLVPLLIASNSQSMDQPDTKKKKKCRGNRKEQHRRRRIRHQQAKLAAANMKNSVQRSEV